MIGLTIDRNTAKEIYFKGIDKQGVQEVLIAFDNPQQQLPNGVSIVLEDDIYMQWQEMLKNPPINVDIVIARALEDAFVIALGVAPEPDNRWALIREE